MKVVFDDEALDDLRGIFTYIAKDNPRAANDVVKRIFERTERLAEPELAHMGHPGRDPGTLELVDAPYIIVYEIFERRGKIVVLSVVHGARNR